MLPDGLSAHARVASWRQRFLHGWRHRFLRRVLLMLLLGNAFVIGLMTFALWQTYRLHYHEAEIATSNLALALENSLVGTIEQHDLALLSVIDEIERQQRSGGIDAATLNAFIDRTYARLPKLNGLRIADEHGYFVWGVNVDPAAGANIADRDYFIVHRDHENAGLFISDPVISRVDGNWAVAFARRFNNPDGSFAGVANTSISLNEFTRTFATLDVGPHGVISLRDENMASIARYPEPGGVGSSVGNTSISKTLRAFHDSGQDSGIYSSASGFDGIHRVFSFRRVGDYPLFILVGRASRDFLASWWDEIVRTALLLTVFVFGSVFAARQMYLAWLRQEQTMAILRDSEATLATRNRELAEARDQALEAMRIKSLFLAGVSHDLKHPLNALGLYLGYLKARPDGVERALPGMQQALGGMGGLLSRLLELSRLESGAMRPVLDTVDASRIVAACVEQFAPMAGEKGIRLTCGSARAVKLVSDPSMLKSIVENLVGNGVRYTERGGVVVGWRRRGEGWRLEVRDTGPGFPEEHIPLLFDAYRRFDDTRAQAGEGYGLGLTLVRRQCELLGCTIDVCSRVGKGSLFAVNIPRC